MKKIKNWFFNRFLPMWAKESVLKDLRKTQDENEELRNKIAELEAYIHGLHAGMKSIRRVVVNAGEVKK
jgi:cell division protein FtsB